LAYTLSLLTDFPDKQHHECNKITVKRKVTNSYKETENNVPLISRRNCEFFSHGFFL